MVIAISWRECFMCYTEWEIVLACVKSGENEICHSCFGWWDVKNLFWQSCYDCFCSGEEKKIREGFPSREFESSFLCNLQSASFHSLAFFDVFKLFIVDTWFEEAAILSAVFGCLKSSMSFNLRFEWIQIDFFFSRKYSNKNISGFWNDACESN